MQLYLESQEIGKVHRERMLAELEQYVLKQQAAADRRRARFWRPDTSSIAAYEKSLEKYRSAFLRMLGKPAAGGRRPGRAPKADIERVAADDLGEISRMWIKTHPGLGTYGMFFAPRTPPPWPLVISQHGGGGTPELCSGLYGLSNYNDMTRRVLRRGFAVFAPQLLLWSEDRGPKHDRAWYDRRLKHMGSSIAALEVNRISRCLDYFACRKDIDPSRIGMIGLSYGGFYTLLAAAADTRIRAALTSCFFSNRRFYDWPDVQWQNAMNLFQDAETAMLVCPRALYIEVGAKDELFDIKHPPAEAAKVRAVYDRLGIPDRFAYREHPGGHELDQADDGIEFLAEHLRR